MENATIDRSLDTQFRTLLLDPTARQAMCQASQEGVRLLWTQRHDAHDLRIVLRFHLKVLRLGKRLAD